MRKIIKMALAAVLTLVVLLVADFGSSVTVSEYRWEALAKAAQRKCAGALACTVSLSDAYTFQWSEAYVFESGPIGYIEYTIGADISRWPHLYPNDYSLDCQSIVFLDERHEVVGYQNSACYDESMEPDFYLTKAEPMATFEIPLSQPHEFYHFTRQASALCATTDDKGREYWLVPYSKEHGCPPVETSHPANGRSQPSSK